MAAAGRGAVGGRVSGDWIRMTKTTTKPSEAVRTPPDASEGVIWTTAVTPSGIEVRYSPSPKRKYEVRGPQSVCGLCQWGDNLDLCHPCEDTWREVPSVTTVLGVLDKPGLPYWGMRVGVAGMLDIYTEKAIHGTVDYLFDTKDGVRLTPERAVELLTKHKLTVNHVRDRSGERGLAVHDAFETWCVTGNKPDPSIFPEEERGYVEGLNAFLDDVKPEPYAAEVMVGSVEHGFAGRYDARIRIPKERQVVYKRTPVRGPKYATLKPGVLLADLKTSSKTYPSHALQLIAYELASVECGYDPTTARGILHVMADGTYEFVRAKADPSDFLAVLEVWRRMERAKDWL